MNVGFISLGRLGTAMVGSLLRTGHEVTVYNRTPNKASVDRPGCAPGCARGRCLPGDAIFTMLATARSVTLPSSKWAALMMLLFVSRHTVPKELRLAEVIVKLLASCSSLLSLDPRESGRELSMFDKLDVRHCKDFELNDPG